MDSRNAITQAPGTIVAAKYRLESPLARGGMGAVWVARHIQLDVPVAVKFMDPGCAASALSRARFEREAKAAASLHNPHIVAVRDYGVEGNVPYLVMELLKGENLGVRLHRERRLSLQATSTILSQIAKALRRAHEGGLIHRDLKPANIFLARQDDDDEVVKVLDFGIAKDTSLMLTRDVTGTGEIMGSPHYMSPEQVRCEKDLDPRADLWSLGVITFRALTGKLPFPGDVLGAILAKVLADPIPVATTLAPELPAGIDAFFARVLVRDRSQRFATVKEMADELAALAAAPIAPPVEAPRAIVFGAPLRHAEEQTRTLVRPPSMRASQASFTSMDGEGAPVESARAPVESARAPVESMRAPVESARPLVESERGMIEGEPTPAAAGLTGPVTLTGAGGATRTVRQPRRRPWIWSGAALGSLVVIGGLIGLLALRGRGAARSEEESIAPGKAVAGASAVSAAPEPGLPPIVVTAPAPVIEVAPAVTAAPVETSATIEASARVPAAPVAAKDGALAAKPSVAPRATSAPGTPRPTPPRPASKPREQHPGIGF